MTDGHFGLSSNLQNTDMANANLLTTVAWKYQLKYNFMIDNILATELKTMPLFQY